MPHNRIMASSYPIHDRLKENLARISAPEALKSVMLETLGEYEHGVADPRDITEKASVGFLSAAYQKFAGWVAAEFASLDLEPTREAIQAQMDACIEADEFPFSEAQRLVLEDLMLCWEASQ